MGIGLSLEKSHVLSKLLLFGDVHGAKPHLYTFAGFILKGLKGSVIV